MMAKQTTQSKGGKKNTATTASAKGRAKAKGPAKPGNKGKKGGNKGKKGTKKSRSLSKQAPHPDRLETQMAVWEAYARLRSQRRVARELGISVWIVQAVLESDRKRVKAVVAEHIEQLVAGWEDRHHRAQGVMDDLIGLCEAMVAEIKQAAQEGRATRILDREGYPMPVLDAMQFMVMSRLLDQMSKLGAQAHQISSSYRQGAAASDAEDQDGSGSGAQRFELMDDAQIAAAIRRGGFKLPPILERKVKRIEAGAEG